MLIDTADARIFVRLSGRGQPLLLIHGLGMSHKLWINQLPALEPRYRVIAVDLRGFGQSSRPNAPGAYAIDALGQDMVGVLEHLDLGPTHILGTSMGGFVAQAMALSRPDLCRSLVLCHTAPRMSIPAHVLAVRAKALQEMSLLDYANIVIEQALHQPAEPALVDWVREMIASNDKQAYTQVLTEGLSDFDVATKLGSIELPTLVIAGEDDRVLPPEGARELASLIPTATLHTITAVGHLSYAEAASEFNAAVLSFLGSLDATG